MSHFHIRWSCQNTLDWERFGSRADAEVSAKQLVRLGETYTIEEHDRDCERCQTALNWKKVGVREETYLSPKGNAPNVKYPWQQTLIDALGALDPEDRMRKVNAAQRSISARLIQLTPRDVDEQTAIRDALQCLRVLIPDRTQQCPTGEKKDVA